MPCVPLTPPGAQGTTVSQTSFKLAPFSIDIFSTSAALTTAEFSCLSSLTTTTVSATQLVEGEQRTTVSHDYPSIYAAASVHKQPGSTRKVDFESLAHPGTSQANSAPDVCGAYTVMTPPISVGSPSRDIWLALHKVLSL